MSGLNSRQRKARRTIKEQTELIAWLTAGRIMEGRNGVPYVLLGEEGSPRKASVCYFHSTRVFRVFAPHPLDRGAQVKYTFSNPKLAAACAKRLHNVGSEAYALWVANGGSEEGLARAIEKTKEKTRRNYARKYGV